jgi:hypothetical protein
MYQLLTSSEFDKTSRTMSQLLSGSEFNKAYPTTVFVKLTNETELHNGFQFTTGLNIDTQKFNPIGECSAGGLYFCEYDKFPMWIEYNGTICVNYREVKIPDDAQVYIETNKFKADKFILSEGREIWNDEKLCVHALEKDPYTLSYIKNQTDELCLIAVTGKGYTLRFVINQTEELCKNAVKQQGNVLYYVKNQTEDICKMAVMQNGYALIHVKDKTDEIYRLAVQQNGNVLEYIDVEQQTDEICKIAIEQNYQAKQYVKKPTSVSLSGRT